MRSGVVARTGPENLANAAAPGQLAQDRARYAEMQGLGPGERYVVGQPAGAGQRLVVARHP